ncbi:Uncharacterised protein [Xylophilus ampelinus]|nr:hypothetical protein [Variovorax sp.]VTY36845.1 Uncharacterised protein [Xylophilus ampelinus]
MAARDILAVAAVLFLVAALLRWMRDGRRFEPASRTWAIVGLLFAAVSAWLRWRGAG